MSGKTFPAPSELVPGTGALIATVTTNLGVFKIRLFEEVAPNTVANFVGLSTGQLPWTDPTTGEDGEGALYKDVIFHRIVPDFVIQGGDPTGTGRGGPGYRFGDECTPDVRHDKAGILSMANSGPGSNGCQFFVTLRATPHLDGKHTVFGEVTDGMDTVEAIGGSQTDGQQRPLTPITIQSIAVARG